MYKKFIYVILLTLVSSCGSVNINNVKIKGVVADNAATPLVGAKVVVLCWRDLGFIKDDVDYYKMVTYTNEQGVFECKFDKGYKADIAVESIGYKVCTLSLSGVGLSNGIVDTIVLKTDVHYNTALFYKDKDSLTLGVKKCRTSENTMVEEWGINVERGRKTTNKNEATVWLKNTGYLLAQQGGGIIPICQDTSSFALLYEYTKAPLSGYVQEYKITGQEVGYFIKTPNNRYGKIILTQRYIKSSPSATGVCEEQGWIANVIYQPDATNRLNIARQLDLEELLLKKY